MIAYHIDELKLFMHKLLATDCFDSFLLEEALVKTAATYHIDGRINRPFYTKEEWEDSTLRPYDFAAWADMRALMFDLIKGRRTPVSFKFVLHLKPEAAAALLQKGDTNVTPSQLTAFVLTVKYDGTALTLVTGTALNTFLADNSPDIIWDNAVKAFLYQKEIAATES